MSGTTVAVSLKMYFDHARTLDYCQRVADLAAADTAVQNGSTNLVLLPTFPALTDALHTVRGSGVQIGAQDLATVDAGAFTGEVSGAELAEIGCSHVEVGHAERRRLFGEDEAVVTAKTQAALRHGLTPILCVGELEPDRPAEAADLCIRQVLSATALNGPAAPGEPRSTSSSPTEVGIAGIAGSHSRHGPSARVLIAYEPVWAIGADRPADSGYVAEVCRRIADALRPVLPHFGVIYGGSAGPGLLTDLSDSVDGLFLGRFAHDPAALADVLAEAARRIPADHQTGREAHA